MRHRQNAYSLVTATLPALIAVSTVIDLFAGRQRDALGSLVLSLSYLAISATVLAIGRRLPRWAGFVVVSVITLAAVFISLSEREHDELNVLLITSMVGLYLGWFHRTHLARILGIALLLLLACAAMLHDSTDSGFSALVAMGHAAVISSFCFEAASMLRRSIDRQAMLDPLTRVYNRRGLVARGGSMLASARRRAWPLTLALIDFDDFKAVNDLGGHHAGDTALRETAGLWVAGFAAQDVVARIGGDEFVLLVRGDRESVEARLRSIRERAHYSWSWGLAEMRPGDTLGELMRRADQRMYHAKDER